MRLVVWKGGGCMCETARETARAADLLKLERSFFFYTDGSAQSRTEPAVKIQRMRQNNKASGVVGVLQTLIEAGRAGGEGSKAPLKLLQGRWWVVPVPVASVCTTTAVRNSSTVERIWHLKIKSLFRSFKSPNSELLLLLSRLRYVQLRS